MTSKEAIDYLKGVRQTITLESVCPFGYYSDSVPYIDLAIKALEREEGCKNQVAQSFLCSACGCYCEYNDEYPVEYNYCPNCGRRVEK